MAGTIGSIRSGRRFPYEGGPLLGVPRTTPRPNQPPTTLLCVMDPEDAGYAYCVTGHCTTGELAICVTRECARPRVERPERRVRSPERRERAPDSWTRRPSPDRTRSAGGGPDRPPGTTTGRAWKPSPPGCRSGRPGQQRLRPMPRSSARAADYPGATGGLNREKSGSLQRSGTASWVSWTASMRNSTMRCAPGTAAASAPSQTVWAVPES